MSVIITKIIKGLRIHGTIGGNIWASSGYSIYTCRKQFDGWHLLGKIPVNLIKALTCKIRGLARLIRAGVHRIIELPNSNILIICDHFFCVSDLNLSFFKSSDLAIKSFQVLDHSVLLSSGILYYGEYFPNLSRGAVKIYYSHDGLNWGTIHSFPPNSIKHIHLIQYDQYAKRLWFSTGDDDKECTLGNANNDFSDIEIVGKGSQVWRSLELLFDRENIYWGTDNPSGENWLFSFERATGKIEKVAKFNGPIYNLKKIDSGYIIITAVEGGIGESDNRARIWHSPSLKEPHWIELASFDKDWMPYIFGFGRAAVCMTAKNLICIYSIGLKYIDNSSLFMEFYQ